MNLERRLWMLVDRCVEVHREIAADPSAPFGFRYRSVEAFSATQSISSLIQRSEPMSVADVLP
jgi:hypothetical protein